MVAEISITYVTIETDGGRVLLPNSQVLAAAVGPGDRARSGGRGAPALATSAGPLRTRRCRPGTARSRADRAL